MERYNNLVFSVPTNTLSSFGKRVYPYMIPPTIPESESDIYVETVAGDRLDLLADEYYLDSTLGWIILAANPSVRADSLFLEPNIQLRIPADYRAVLALFDLQNKSR